MTMIEFANEWVNLPRMQTQRSACGVAAASEHELIVAGGFNGSTLLASVDLLDLRSNKWESLPDMPQPRSGNGAVVIDRCVYVIGGGDSIMLDLENPENGWKKIPPMSHADRLGCAVVGLDNCIIVIGGYHKKEGCCLTSVEMYNTEKEEWKKLPDMPTRRTSPAAAAVGRKLMVAGGWDNNITLSVLEVLDLDAMKWKKLADMPTPRSGGAGSALEGAALIVAGGVEGSANQVTPFDKVEMFEIAAGTWQRLPDLDSPRAYCGGAMVGTQFVVVGGSDDNRFYLPTLESLTLTIKHEFFKALRDVRRMDEDAVEDQLRKLLSVMSDFLQLKIFYTAINVYYRIGVVDKATRLELLQKALDKCVKMCFSNVYCAMYRITLDRALQDGVIDSFSKYALEGAALETQMEHSEFFTQVPNDMVTMYEAFENLRAHVPSDDLTGRQLAAVVDSVRKSVKKATKAGIVRGSEDDFYNRLETGSMFLQAVVTAVSMGATEQNLQSELGLSLERIVDFGNPYHLEEIIHCVTDTWIDDVEDMTLQDKFNLGKELAKEEGNTKLDEDSTVEILAAVTALVFPIYVADQPTASNTRKGKPKEDNHDTDNHSTNSGITTNTNGLASTACEGGDFNDQLDADDEKNLPVWSAIKYGYIEDLEYEFQFEDVDLNEVDSKGRTAADYAAIKGELEMIRMIEKKGGRFKIMPRPTMMALARERSLHKKK
jgi:hypothetical protein